MENDELDNGRLKMIVSLKNAPTISLELIHKHICKGFVQFEMNKLTAMQNPWGSG